MVIWGTLRESFLRDRMGHKDSSNVELWFLLVEAIVMVRVHRVGGVIIKEVVVETIMVVIQGRVEYILLGRSPRLIIEVSLIPF